MTKAKPDALVLRSDPVRLRDAWRDKRLRFLTSLADANEPLNGETVALRAGETVRYATAAYKLIALRKRGYVANAGCDDHGLLLWRITPAGRKLVKTA